MSGAGQIVATSSARRKPSGAASVRIDVSGARALQRAMQRLGQTDAPFIREALEDVGGQLAGAIRAFGRPSITRRIEQDAVRARGVGSTLPMAVVHPAAAVFEFGRQWWYRAPAQRAGRRGWDGRIGNNRPGSKRRPGVFKKFGERIKYHPGMPARPYVGILDGGHAIGAVQPFARERFLQAFAQEWERLAAEGDD